MFPVDMCKLGVRSLDLNGSREGEDGCYLRTNDSSLLLVLLRRTYLPVNSTWKLFISTCMFLRPFQEGPTYVWVGYHLSPCRSSSRTSSPYVHFRFFHSVGTELLELCPVHNTWVLEGGEIH